MLKFSFLQKLCVFRALIIKYVQASVRSPDPHSLTRLLCVIVRSKKHSSISLQVYVQVYLYIHTYKFDTPIS